MFNWIKGSALFCAFKQPLEIDIINHPYAKAVTPDDIIEAHIINDIAKNIGEWRLTESYENTYRDGYSIIQGNPNHYQLSADRRNRVKKSRLLRSNRTNGRFTKPIDVVLVETAWMNRILATQNWIITDVENGKAEVNSVSFDVRKARAIFTAYSKLLKQKQAADEAAAKALKKMQDEEAKWNLAENLLGLRRNEHGALVPAVAVEAGE